jgi:DNA-directed RNA polymerase specialized sigma24 family protein
VLRETWSLGDVRDVEAFCGDVITKFTHGERVAHQPGSEASFSAADKEDLLAYLLAASWQAWLKFNPVDDGRGTNRFSGFLVWTLHRRVVDWIRLTYGSTRYPSARIAVTLVPLTSEIGARIPAWLDPEYDDSDALDLDAAPAGTREALELLQPLLDGEPLSQGQLAALHGVPSGRVQKAVQLVRAEARRQGLAPPSAVNDERKALADRARDLHEQGMNYRQIGAELGCSAVAARSLLANYHPALLPKPRTRRATANPTAQPDQPLAVDSNVFNEALNGF